MTSQELAQTQTSPGPAAAPQPAAERANRYVARILQQHLAAEPDKRWWTEEGAAAYADLSGFTRLSEALARKGREGAEQITDVIGRMFELLLAIAYEAGGSLIKFGGDSLLLWFDGEGHAERACRAAVLMRQVLRDAGEIDLPDARTTLQVSQGVHAGTFHFFAVGTSHLELLPVGPAWSRLAALEHDADPDEILVSADTAARLPDDCVGAAKGAGVVLEREPPGYDEKRPLRPRPKMSAELVAQCLPPALRAHVMAGGGGIPDHRPVTIAFIRFGGTDALIEERGADEAATALHRLVEIVQGAALEQEVALLVSDVDADGGKLILTAGAPRVTGNDEERMLLALRRIVGSALPLPVRIGVHRGAVFAGDIGPAYRRTYTVMGDVVNLAARLMAKAPPGHIYATADLLEHSNTLFETERLEPFAVKGKAQPIQAWSVGKAQGSRTRQVSVERLPLTGRNAELGLIRKAFTSARSGAGRIVEVVAEAGVGKTRLLEALRDAAATFKKLHATCEAYTANTPYALWSELLRESMGFGRDDADALVAERLSAQLAERAPDLVPWLPLIAIAFGLDVAPTPEVEMLADKNRRAKLHESVARFLELTMTVPVLIEIENAQHIDEASAGLLSFLAASLASRPWLFAVARRPGGALALDDSPTVVRIELKPLTLQDAFRMAQLATKEQPLPEHVLEIVAKRSGGNPQFLRDLLRTAVESGGAADLPDSAEAAAMAQIDLLAPEDRALVRRAAVFGQTFHPRMLEWFADEHGPSPTADVWARLGDFFDGEPDGYLRFRRSLLRDAAYAGLPYKLRRVLHGTVAARLEAELEHPDEAGEALSLHFFEAAEYRPAWRYATAAARRAEGAYAYVEAAGLYARALDAGRRIADVEPREMACAHQSLGDAWYRAGEFRKASDAYGAVRPLVAAEPLAQAALLLKLSQVDEKLGQYAAARRSTEEARDALRGTPGPEAARQLARLGAWYAMVLQLEGRTDEALEWGERAADEAEAADDPDALGDAYFVVGWAYGELGREGAHEIMQKSLDAYQRAGNLVRQAGVLASLGVVSQWQGRWDEAWSYYEQGRDAAAKIGSTVAAAVARINVAEILTDRGEWTEAEAVLLETLPFWKSSQYHYHLGFCLLLLGRVSLRTGRLGEAMARLDEARSTFVQVGAEPELPAVDARIAECRLAMGDPALALETVAGVFERANPSASVARATPLLERIRGHALLVQGDLWGARDALEASLAAAQERSDIFETTLTMLSLIELDRLEGVEPPLDMVSESRSRLASLKVRAVPPMPQPPKEGAAG